MITGLTAGDLRLARNQLHRLPKWILDQAHSKLQDQAEALRRQIYALPEGREKEAARHRRAQIHAVQRQFTGHVFAGDAQLIAPLVKAAKVYLQETAESALPRPLREAGTMLAADQGLAGWPAVILIALGLLVVALSVGGGIYAIKKWADDREATRAAGGDPDADTSPWPWVIGGAVLLVGVPLAVGALSGRRGA